MTIPIGRLEAQLGADFGDFDNALAAVEQGLGILQGSITKTGGSLGGLESASGSASRGMAGLQGSIADTTTSLHGLESFSGQFEATLRSLSSAAPAAASPIDDLEQRTRDLTNAWRVGLLSEEDFAAGLQQLKIDVTEAASATAAGTRDMDRLANIGGTVTSSLRQAEAAIRGVAESVPAVGGPVDDLERRTQELTNAWRVGLLTEEEFAGGLRQLKADIAEAAASTATGTRDMERLAGVGSTVNSSLRQVTMQARRTAQGFEAVGVSTLAATQAMSGGIRGVAGAASTLQVFALGNPAMIGILSGVTALASAIALLKDDADEASAAMQSAMQSARGMGEAGLLAHITALASEAVRLGAEGPKIRDFIDALMDADEGPGAGGPIRLGNRRLDAMLEQIEALQSALRVLRNEPVRLGNREAPDTGGFTDVLPMPDMTNIPLAIEGNIEATERWKASLRTTTEAITTMATAAVNAFGVGGTGGDTPLADILKLEAPLEEFAQTTFDVSNMVGEAFAGIGESLGGLISGSVRGFKGLAASLGSILGGLLKTVGQSLIAFGVAGLRIQQFIKNPAGAIAAGVALVALGSALASAATKSVSSAGDSLAGGGGGSGGGGGFASPGSAVGSAQTGGNVTIVFPRDAVIDPGNVKFQDFMIEILKQAGARNVQMVPA